MFHHICKLFALPLYFQNNLYFHVENFNSYQNSLENHYFILIYFCDELEILNKMQLNEKKL